MTETYLKDTATELNKVFQFYKAKLKELPKEATTDEEIDKVADWFGDAMNEVTDMCNSISDKDVCNFVGHFVTAILLDLEDKYHKRYNHVEYRWLGNIDDIEQFISTCKRGDSVRYKGVEIEVKSVD